MRPLYLKGKSGMRVVYDEPALVVNVPDQTRQLFPIDRISRVVVSGHVDWSMGALFACAEANVSVLFMDASGQVKGRWMGKSLPDGALQGVFRLLSNVDAMSRYANWYNGMQRMAARSAAKRLHWPDWQTTDLDRLTDNLERQLDPAWRRVRSWLCSVIAGAVTEYVHQFGAAIESDADMAWLSRLINDLSGLLLADFYPLLLQWSQTAAQPPADVELLQRFESRGGRLDQLLRGALAKLHVALREDY